MRYMTAADGAAAFELGARLGSVGTFALGADGGDLSRMLARCAGSGGALAGADVLFHDGTTPACGAWLSRHYDLPASLFFLEEQGRVSLWLKGKGREAGWERLPPPGRWPGTVGRWDQLVGADESFAAHVVGDRQAPGVMVSVLPAGGQKPLVTALERMGCEVLRRPKLGVPVLSSDRAGFVLTVRAEQEEVRLRGADAVSAAAEWCAHRAGTGWVVSAFRREEGDKRV